MCCLALLWSAYLLDAGGPRSRYHLVTIWSSLPRAADLDNSATPAERRTGEPVCQHHYLHLVHLLRAAVIHHRRVQPRPPEFRGSRCSPVPGAADDHAGGDDADYADPENLRYTSHPHRGDDALLHQRSAKPMRQGVRHPDGGGGADGGLPLVAGAALALLPMSWPSAGLATVSITQHWFYTCGRRCCSTIPDKQVLTVGWSFHERRIRRQWGTIGAAGWSACR